MISKYYFGHSDRVCACIDRRTNKTTVTYNLSDSTGEHSFTCKHFAALPLELKDALYQEKNEAIADARERRAYAMARERDTTIEKLRYCYLVTVGHGGTSYHYDDSPDSHGKVQSHYPPEAEVIAEIDRLQIPYVDITSIPLEECFAPSIRGPMPPSKPDNYDVAPWGAFSFAPIAEYAAFWYHFGALVRWVNLPAFDQSKYTMFKESK